MPPATRGRAAWVIPLLLFLALLLAAGLAFNLANLNTGGEQMPGPSSSGSSPANPWGLFDPAVAELLFVLMIGGLVTIVLVMILLRRRGTKVKRVLRPTTWADVIATIVVFGMLMAILFLWPQIASRVGPHGIPGNSTANGTANATALPVAGGVPLGYFLAGAVLASIVALALFLRVGLDIGGRVPSGPLVKRRLAAVQALEAAIEEIQLGGDVRAAILACYHRFCLFLGVRGVLGQEVLTPRELEGLAVRDLAVSAESADSLTSLFEEARYSEHPLGDADRERAVRSLERIRADLGV